MQKNVIEKERYFQSEYLGMNRVIYLAYLGLVTYLHLKIFHLAFRSMMLLRLEDHPSINVS